MLLGELLPWLLKNDWFSVGSSTCLNIKGSHVHGPIKLRYFRACQFVRLLSAFYPVNPMVTKTEDRLRALMEDYKRAGTLPNGNPEGLECDDPEHEHRNLTQVFFFTPTTYVLSGKLEN